MEGVEEGADLGGGAEADLGVERGADGAGAEDEVGGGGVHRGHDVSFEGR